RANPISGSLIVLTPSGGNVPRPDQPTKEPGMPQSPEPDSEPRREVAPPRITRRPVQRTGYIVLAASGLVLATAFAGIAQLAAPAGDGPGSQLTAHAEGSGTPQGAGSSETSDFETTRTVEGEALTEPT